MFLGAEMHQKMTWRSHIEEVRKKTNALFVNYLQNLKNDTAYVTLIKRAVWSHLTYAYQGLCTNNLN